MGYKRISKIKIKIIKSSKIETQNFKCWYGHYRNETLQDWLNIFIALEKAQYLYHMSVPGKILENTMSENVFSLVTTGSP